ncbi:MAG TPA: hypothetical protein P5171_06860 [Xanthomonadaceae bacterium]|mgnify:CR=1 FL=1|nr:hypothetical protein [Xanthomonadales bacterium]HPF73435.1 hypothetical protein [Xanthomonadaceae bacterium]HRX99830.1 hypothetical protein [Xanthomonadaceae bacterium]
MTRFLLAFVVLVGIGTSVDAATLRVTINADNLGASAASCTLREAIVNATTDTNTYPECLVSGAYGDDTIEFFDSLLITLNPGLGTLQVNAGGNLTLNGSASHSIQLIGDDTFPLMEVGDIPYFEANLFAFTHGRGSSGAGGITIGAQVAVLDQVTFAANSSGSGAGAIQRRISGASNGSLTVSNCIITSNSSADGGGAIRVDYPTTRDWVTFQDCQIVNNTADNNGGAVYLLAADDAGATPPRFHLINSRLQNNEALGETGGAISAFIPNQDATLLLWIEDSGLIDNRANGDGGAVFLQGHANSTYAALLVYASSLIGNQAGYQQATGNGGAIAASSATAGIQNSFFLDNDAPGTGGALDLRETGSELTPRKLVLAGNTFHGNRMHSASGGHALYLVSPNGANATGSGLLGNLFSRPTAVDGNPECVFAAVSSNGDFSYDNNYSEETSCQFGASDGNGPVDLIIAPNGSDLKTPYRAYAGASSAANDFWQDNCVDVGGAALVVDLLGNGRPKDFDGAGGEICDAGAFERGAQGSLSATTPTNGHIYGAPLGSVIGPGSDIDCGADCNQLYLGGTMVRLVYQADPGTYFAGWGGDCSGVADCIVAIDGAKSVFAFTPASTSTYDLDVTLAGDGGGRVDSTNRSGIACAPLCTASFAATMPNPISVSLSATPDAHSQFDGWTIGSCFSVVNDVCTVKMDAAKTAEANFTAFEFLVDVTVDGDGSGSVSSSVAGIDCPDSSCSAYFDRNQTIQLTAATSFGGGTFAGWSGDCNGISAICDLDMNGGPYNVTATFVLQHALTVNVSGGGFVTSNPAGIDCPGDCSESYNSNVTVELTPNPAPDQVFIGWSGDCSGTGSCQVSMDAARSVTANFGNVSVFADGFE